jgi:hypothetical protein
MGYLAEKSLAPGHVPRLLRITKGIEAENAAKRLLKRWRGNPAANPPLAAAANEILKNPEGRE